MADRIAIIDHGRIIAEDDPAILKRKILVRRLFEVEVDASPNGQMRELEDLVDVEEIEGTVIRYRTDDPHTINPQLVRRLDGLGLGVVSLHEIAASLEDVYLNVVGGNNDDDPK